MLIDFAPDPGPGARSAKGANPAATGVLGDEAGSFRSVLAQAEGAMHRGRDAETTADWPPPEEAGSVATEPEKELPLPGETRDETAAWPVAAKTPPDDQDVSSVRVINPPGKESPPATAAPAVANEVTPALASRVATTSASAGLPIEGQRGFPSQAAVDPTPLRAAHPDVAGTRSGAAGLIGAEPSVKSPTPVDPATVRQAADAKAQVDSPGKELTQRMSADRPVPAVTDAQAAAPLSVGQKAPPAGAPVPAATVALFQARLSEAQLSGRKLPDGSSFRTFEGLASGFSTEGLTPSMMTEASADRLLRPAAPAAAELPREVAQQIGARITPLARGQFELALSPAELGRLEITLREIDGVMTLSVNAERPETLDLIRRHIDLLAQELRQIAQRELTLQLGAGGLGAGNRDGKNDLSGSGTQPAGDALADTATGATISTAVGRDHLDLRL
ncbi:flagellar hook-length control protein FliK [Pararhodobacter sp. SW119]|uniref:flagellar hook-length control protein FliK n=1 Tax=Pararhodobacter sp. SW119 TaxID=2780075 RepID=UPI001AE008C2|nr:flagellar hook-length control protein FliK [Pararhodobacter sp. SW119]